MRVGYELPIFLTCLTNPEYLVPGDRFTSMRFSKGTEAYAMERNHRFSSGLRGQTMTKATWSCGEANVFSS